MTWALEGRDLVGQVVVGNKAILQSILPLVGLGVVCGWVWRLVCLQGAVGSSERALGIVDLADRLQD